MELCHARPCRRHARFNSKQNQDGNGRNPSCHDSPVVLAEDIDDLEWRHRLRLVQARLDLPCSGGREPHADARHQCHDGADHRVDRHRRAVLETKQPRRYDKRQPGAKIDPFLPDRERGKRGKSMTWR